MLGEESALTNGVEFVDQSLTVIFIIIILASYKPSNSINSFLPSLKHLLAFFFLRLGLEHGPAVS